MGTTEKALDLRDLQWLVVTMKNIKIHRPIAYSITVKWTRNLIFHCFKSHTLLFNLST